jgi:hypothetical protein
VRGIGVFLELSDAKMDDNGSQLRLGKHGGPRIKGQRSNDVTLPQRGNSRTYIVHRLARDGRTDLVAMVRNRQISAYAAARKAGFGGPARTHRQPKPKEPEPVDVETFVKSLIG